MTLREQRFFKQHIVIRLRWVGTAKVLINVHVKGRNEQGRVITTCHPVLCEIRSDMTRREAMATLREAMERSIYIGLACDERQIVGTDAGGEERLRISMAIDYTAESLQGRIADALACNPGSIHLFEGSHLVFGEHKILQVSEIHVKWVQDSNIIGNV